MPTYRILANGHGLPNLVAADFDPDEHDFSDQGKKVIREILAEEVLHEFEAEDYWAANEVWKQWLRENVPGMEDAVWTPVAPIGGFKTNSEDPDA